MRTGEIKIIAQSVQLVSWRRNALRFYTIRFGLYDLETKLHTLRKVCKKCATIFA